MNQTKSSSVGMGPAALALATPIMAGALGYLLGEGNGLAAGTLAGFLILMVGAQADARSGRPHHAIQGRRRPGIRKSTYLLFADAIALFAESAGVIGRQTGWIMFGLKPAVENEAATPLELRNRRLFRTCLFGAMAMVGVAFAAVPIYAMFCSVTGYGGTPAKSDGNFKGVVDRPITVRFDSNVDSTLPWKITPAASVTRDIGTVELINYVATNTSDKPVTAMAIFNVSPEKAGVYFNKVECFCFTEQTLQPGETMDMPIVFFVDPDFADNRELDTLKEITLSYTFYRK